MRLVSSIREWWRTLGYCWNSKEEELRTFGIRPFGKRWFWFVIDDSDTAGRSEEK